MEYPFVYRVKEENKPVCVRCDSYKFRNNLAEILKICKTEDEVDYVCETMMDCLESAKELRKKEIVKKCVDEIVSKTNKEVPKGDILLGVPNCIFLRQGEYQPFIEIKDVVSYSRNEDEISIETAFAHNVFSKYFKYLVQLTFKTVNTNTNLHGKEHKERYYLDFVNSCVRNGVSGESATIQYNFKIVKEGCEYEVFSKIF